MKLFHLSDLHIGKQLNGYNLRENQTRILQQIVDHAKTEHPDAILICGDIYDKSAPSGEAYAMFDRFLDDLSGIRPEIPVLIIAGNHDSPERLAYASAFLEKHHIYLSVFPPKEEMDFLKKITLRDEYGPVNFYLLPFLKPGYVRPLVGEENAVSYEAAVRAVLQREALDRKERNVLLSHQFYTAAAACPDTCESETAVLLSGGLDQIDVSVLDAFDYAALGHLHGPQKVGRDTVRYCGTPYKYSVSEEHHRKSIAVITLAAKGEPIQLEFLPLTDAQDVRSIRGTLSEVIAAAKGKDACHDYVSITLTDEQDTYRVREILEELYDHILELRIDNTRTRTRLAEPQDAAFRDLTPLESFQLFYETLQGEKLSPEEEKIIESIIQTSIEEF